MLIAYGLALVVTPALVYLAAGELVGLGPIALTLGAGLVAPAVLARVLHPQIARIPQRVRRGWSTAPWWSSASASAGACSRAWAPRRPGLTLGVVVVALLARSAVGSAVATRIAPPALKTEAPFAVAFKNVALAAAVGGSLVGAVAALPASWRSRSRSSTSCSWPSAARRSATRV